MLHTGLDYYKSCRGRCGQRSSIEQIRTSAHYIGYNNMELTSISDSFTTPQRG